MTASVSRTRLLSGSTSTSLKSIPGRVHAVLVATTPEVAETAVSD